MVSFGALSILLVSIFIIIQYLFRYRELEETLMNSPGTQIDFDIETPELVGSFVRNDQDP